MNQISPLSYRGISSMTYFLMQYIIGRSTEQNLEGEIGSFVSSIVDVTEQEEAVIRKSINEELHEGDYYFGQDFKEQASTEVPNLIDVEPKAAEKFIKILHEEADIYLSGQE